MKSVGFVNYISGFCSLFAKITDWKNCVFKNLFRVNQNLVNGPCHRKPGKLVKNKFPGLMAQLFILIQVIDMTCILKLSSKMLSSICPLINFNIAFSFSRIRNCVRHTFSRTALLIERLLTKNLIFAKSRK